MKNRVSVFNEDEMLFDEEDFDLFRVDDIDLKRKACLVWKNC